MKDTNNKIMEVTVKMNIADSEAGDRPNEDACFVESTKAAADHAGNEFWKLIQPLNYPDAVTLIGKLYDLSNGEAPVNALHLLESLFIVSRMNTGCRIMNDVMLYAEECDELCVAFLDGFLRNSHIEEYLQDYKEQIEELD